MKDSSASIESNKKRLDKHLKRLRDLDYLPGGHVDFFESITRAHYEAKDRIQEDTIYPSLGKEQAEEMLSKGFPLMTFDRMKVKEPPLRAHFKEICTILTDYEETEPGEVGTFSKSEEHKTLDLKEFVSRTLSQDPGYLKQVSEKTGVNGNTLTFMAISLARPLFELAAAQMKETLNGYSWWKNYCPGCGSEPFMARIRTGDNMRILGCSLCGTGWNFDRVKCPFCDEHDPSGKSLKVFYYQEESPHRLSACDTLARDKGYIRGSTFRDTKGQEHSLKQQDSDNSRGGGEATV
jgi:FdhE protein